MSADPKRSLRVPCAQYTFGHFEYESNEEDVIIDYDVIMVQSVVSPRERNRVCSAVPTEPSDRRTVAQQVGADRTIGIKNVFVPWELSKQYDVVLDEAAGWVVTSNGKKPTTVEFLGVLQVQRVAT